MDAVRKEVEAVHEVSARSKSDLQSIADSRSDLATLKTLADELLRSAAKTRETVSVIEDRRRIVDDVHLKTNQVLNLADDVRVKVDLLSEQRAVVEHVSEQLAKLSTSMQEAQTTMRGLQTER